MQTSAPPSAAEYLRFLPEIILSAVATLVMILEPFTGAGKKNALAGLTLAAFLSATAAAIYANGFPGTAFSSLLIVDGFGALFRVLVIVAGALTVFLSNPFLGFDNLLHDRAPRKHAERSFPIVPAGLR